jgi:hypothetical protein
MTRQNLISRLALAAGLAPMISLSLYSFVNSGIWASLTQLEARSPTDFPFWRFDLALLPVVSSWQAVAIVGFALLLAALAQRTGTVPLGVVGMSILAQLPGIISHTQFPWLWLAGSGSPVVEGSSIVLVGLALMATPVGIYSLGATSAFDSLEATLTRSDVDLEDIADARLGNFLLLTGVIASILAAGALAVALPTGLARELAGLFVKSGPVMVWLTVAGSVVLMALFYSYLYERWSSQTPSAAPIDLSVDYSDREQTAPE